MADPATVVMNHESDSTRTPPPIHDKNLMGGETRASRKRAHSIDEDEGSPSPEDPFENNHSAKRSRSTNWPLKTDMAAPVPISNANRRHISSPARSSKFQEASMRDRPSDKPPSVFMRVMKGVSNTNTSIDHLMDDYHSATNKEESTGKDEAKHSRTQSSASHRYASASSMASHDSKESGIFRFGRSLAATFNPNNIFQKIKNTRMYQESRQELIDQQIAENKRLMEERRLKAEQEYAKLKAAGQLGAQNTSVFRSEGDILSATSNQRGSSETNPRDSGIDMDDIRSSVDSKDAIQQKINHPVAPVPGSKVAGTPRMKVAPTPGPSSTRKSSFHFRTPSLSDLKKVKSHINFHGDKAPLSVTSERTLPDTPRSREVRKEQSKKDFQRQVKLTKRVSDLESKLQEARRELNAALGVPPVPQVPALPDVIRSAANSRASSPMKKSFVLGRLPTLPSERLLFPEQLDTHVDDSHEESPSKFGDHVETHEGTASHGALSSLSDNENDIDELSLPGHPSTKPRKMVDNDENKRPTAPAKLRKMPLKKTTAKKRKSGDTDDLHYKPDAESDDDAEWDVATTKTPKKRRGIPKPVTAKSTPTKLVKKTTVKTTQVATSDTDVVVEAFEQEEDVTVSKVALASTSKKPTAFATPSHHPGRLHRSPSSTKLMKGRNALSRKRSVDSASERSKSVISVKSEDEVLVVKPNGGDVPPVPALPKLGEDGAGKKEEQWEWPEDVF